MDVIFGVPARWQRGRGAGSPVSSRARAVSACQGCPRLGRRAGQGGITPNTGCRRCRRCRSSGEGGEPWGTAAAAAAGLLQAGQRASTRARWEGTARQMSAFFIFFFFPFNPFIEYHLKSPLIMHLSAQVWELCLLVPIRECLSSCRVDKFSCGFQMCVHIFNEGFLFVFGAGPYLQESWQIKKVIQSKGS